MRKSLFKHLTERGIQVRRWAGPRTRPGSICVSGPFQVYVWVLNDEEDFRRAFDLGATGVMTDFPSRLKDFMDQNGISRLE